MKHGWCAITVILLFDGIGAGQKKLRSDKADKATEDCSKQVWPHFTPSCLRSMPTEQSMFAW